MTTATTTITAEPGSHAIEITRDFAATPEQLLRAHTDPQLLARWIGPRDYSMDVELLEPRHGGRWRYLNDNGAGEVFGFHGVFHNDPSVEHGVIQTFEFEGYPGAATIEKLTFEDLGDGRTRLHAISVHLSVESRDGMIASGMEKGVVQGYEQLDALLAADAA